METIKPGHTYILPNLDSKEKSVQVLYFVMREGENYPGNIGTQAGTTSQEVLRALIDRAEYVNNQKPCAETEAAAELMKAALILLELRAARLHERTLDTSSIQELLELAQCPKCNHSGCEGSCREN